jgi:hypothetical protein
MIKLYDILSIFVRSYIFLDAHVKTSITCPKLSIKMTNVNSWKDLNEKKTRGLLTLHFASVKAGYQLQFLSYGFLWFTPFYWGGGGGG